MSPIPQSCSRNLHVEHNSKAILYTALGSMHSPSFHDSIDVLTSSFFGKMASQQAKQASCMGAMFDIVGIKIGNRGRSCLHLQHHVCCIHMVEGMMVRLKREIIKVDGLEEVVISVYLEGGGGRWVLP